MPCYRKSKGHSCFRLRMPNFFSKMQHIFHNADTDGTKAHSEAGIVSIHGIDQLAALF